jgi:uncharacterized protein (TIGR03435 family)
MVALAQGVGARFDVASVRIGALPQTGVAGMTSGWPGSESAGRSRGRLVTLEQLVELAYDVRLFQVEGPSWINSDDLEHRFDISAVYDPDTTKEQFQRMMQDLLAERFHLRVHRITKVPPAYELLLANGGFKLKASTSSTTSLMTTPAKGGVRLSSKAVTISRIIPFLQPHLEQYQLVDKTGLTGTYDITLEFAPMSRSQSRIAMELSGITSDEGFVFPSLSTALQEQAGLRLVKGTAPFEVLVIDSADKVPTEN